MEHLSDLDLLQRTARTVGLGSLGVRRVCWPLLTRVSVLAVEEQWSDALRSAPADEQVAKDVARSLFMVQAPQRRAALRLQLERVVCAVLHVNRTSLSYYQGFHDVATVVLLVVKRPATAAAVLARLALGPLRPALGPDLKPVTSLLELLWRVVQGEDAQLFDFLQRSGVQPFFALPWLLTWFSHSIANFDSVCRLFDLFLVEDCSLPFFVSAAVVLWTRNHVIRSVECEYSSVHSFYSKLFSDIPMTLNAPEPQADPLGFAALFDKEIESILQRALRLHAKYQQVLRMQSALPFMTEGSKEGWSLLPRVVVDKVHKTDAKEIESFRYRFEGMRKARSKERMRIIAIVILSVIVCLIAVWFAKIK